MRCEIKAVRVEILKFFPILGESNGLWVFHDDKEISSISRDFFPVVFMFSWKLIEFYSVYFPHLLKWYFSFPFYSITIIFDIDWLSLHKLNNLTVLGSSHLIIEYYLYYCAVKLIFASILLRLFCQNTYGVYWSIVSLLHWFWHQELSWQNLATSVFLEVCKNPKVFLGPCQ